LLSKFLEEQALINWQKVKKSMDYKDYQKASYKHLVTCKAILESIILLNSNPSAQIIQNSKQKAVLHNIYYLSGYTLESVINYAIYKHFRWRNSSVRDVDHSFSQRCGLSYGRLRKISSSGEYPYFISGHEFSRNIQILQKEFSNSQIPLIDRTELVDVEVVKLFKAWCVEIRYHKETESYSNVTLSYDNINLFVETTEKIYNGLISKVGLP
jgi:hypothetical protein